MKAKGIANFPKGGTSAKYSKQRSTESGDIVFPRKSRQVVNTSVGLYSHTIWKIQQVLDTFFLRFIIMMKKKESCNRMFQKRNNTLFVKCNLIFYPFPT